MQRIPKPPNIGKDAFRKQLASAWEMETCLNNLHKQAGMFTGATGATLLTKPCYLLVAPGGLRCGPCVKDFMQWWRVKPGLAILGFVWHLSQLQRQAYEAELAHHGSTHALWLELLLPCYLPGNRLGDPVLFSVSNFHHQWPVIT